MLGKALTTAAAGNAAGEALGIEDVFQTWLYTGNGSTQTITNGIDLSGKGGLVWLKRRATGNHGHALFDTARGADYLLETSATSAQASGYTPDYFGGFSSTGFSFGSLSNFATLNATSATYTSWTFRKQAKFFDVVTYVGDNVAGRTIAHSLGSTPGVIIVKRLDTSGPWVVYHRSLGNGQYLFLNSTIAANPGDFWNYTNPTSTVFSVGNTSGVNASGGTYVAYLFAHDAGGFGDSGNESVIKCGSFTTDGTGAATVSLGWEPQWLLVKSSDVAGVNWFMADSMRGMPVGSANDALLLANTADAEIATDRFDPTATGFITKGLPTGTFVYIAIRRGPMKTPTDATKVFSANASNASAGTDITTGFPVDMQITSERNNGLLSGTGVVHDRLRGFSSTDTEVRQMLRTHLSDAEFTAGGTATRDWDNTGFDMPAYPSTLNTVFWNFRRAPGFFDVVAYTGTASTNQQVTHNLTVAPELIIVKHRATTAVWLVYLSYLGRNKYLSLNTTNAVNTYSNSWGTVDPTATTFNINTNDLYATGNIIAYLFASCPGVSKVGSYTGTGTTQQIDCGFTSGARFVLIKRTDTQINGQTYDTDWYVWDTARGIVSGNDPYLTLNETAAEVTNTDYIDPLNAGFQISSTAPAAINANGGTFIYLAIA